MTRQTTAPPHFFTKLVSTVDAVLWEADAVTLRYAFISSQVEAWLGYEVDRWLAEPEFWAAHMHEEDRAGVLARVREATAVPPDADQIETLHLEYRFRAADGRTIWVRDNIRVLFEAGQAVRLYGVKLDITSLKQTANELRRRKEILNNVVYISQRLFATGNFQERMREFLARLGRLLQVSRIYIFQNTMDEAGVLRTSHRYEWLDDERAFLTNLPDWQNISYAEMGFERWRRQLCQGGVIHGRVADLPPSEQQILRSWGLASVLVAPIWLGEQWWGFLAYGDCDRERDWSSIEIEAVTSVASALGAVLANYEQYKAERLARERAEVLREFARIVNSSLSQQEILQESLRQLKRVLVFDTASIYLMRRSGRPDFVAGIGFTDEVMTSRAAKDLLNNSPILGQMAQDLKMVFSPDVHHLPGWIWVPGAEHVRSFVAAPLISHEEMIGALMIDSRRVNFFTQEDGEIVRALAQHLAGAVENARLFEEARHRLDELAVLHQVALVTAATVDMDELLTQMTRLIVKTLYPEMFGVLLVDRKEGHLFAHDSYHGIPQSFCDVPVPRDQSVTGWVAKTGKVRIVPDVREEPLFFLGKDTTLSEIAAPLRLHGEVVGVINVESSRLNAFSESDAQFLMTLAGLLSVTMERAVLYETLKEHATLLAQEVEQQTDELQAERDRTLAILESAGEGVFLTDLEMNITYVNPAMAQQSGYSRQALLDKNMSVLSSKQTATAVYGEMWHSLALGQRWSGEMVNRRRDGTLYDVALTVTPVQDATGEMSGFVCIQADISRLKELDRLKSEFVSNVSHELRTPLTNIKMYLTLLERGRAEHQDRYLQTLHHEVDRLTRLIQDLLDLSRLEAAPDSDETSVADVAQVVAQVSGLFAAKAEARNIQFQQQIPAGLPPVCMAPHHLTQVLNNLLGNAVTYTPSGGQVTVAAGILARRRGQSPVWLRVSDTGPGIAREELPDLFDRFYRGAAALALGAPGTGLGLAISKEIVERYGGKIAVASKEGDGSHFTVMLISEDGEAA